MREEKPDEVTARGLMSAVLGVPVERHDDGNRHGQHDFVFRLADGRTGAAEMTSITDPDDRRWLAHSKLEPKVPGSNWAWHVRRRGHSVTLNDLLLHLETLAPIAELNDERDVGELARRAELIDNASAEWVRTNRIDIDGLPGHSQPGRVFFSGDTVGFVGEVTSLEPTLAWIEDRLAGDEFDADFAKINNSGCDEQHLVLRVDIGSATACRWALRTSAALSSEVR